MNANVEKSKLLARWLRHRPDAIGLVLDNNGWADLDELLLKAAETGINFRKDELLRIAAEDDKQRYSLSADGLRIRAAQGHSVSVDLRLPVKTPPPVLYHGTVHKFLPAIRDKGLLPGNRRDVHLSANTVTAESVSRRRGEPVVLIIVTHALLKDGYFFRQSVNGVWLTGAVPARYITFPAS